MRLREVYESGRVNRFHTVADYAEGVRQSNAEHQWGVALIALELCHLRGLSAGDTLEVVRVALIHDAEERVLGDLPATAKWQFPELAAAYRRAEVVVRAELGIQEPHLSEEQETIVKWADCLELYAYCARKGRTGNTVYYEIMDNIFRHMTQQLPMWPQVMNIVNDLS